MDLAESDVIWQIFIKKGRGAETFILNFARPPFLYDSPLRF
jgi:hypothetical protein